MSGLIDQCTLIIMFIIVINGKISNPYPNSVATGLNFTAMLSALIL